MVCALLTWRAAPRAQVGYLAGAYACELTRTKGAPWPRRGRAAPRSRARRAGALTPPSHPPPAGYERVRNLGDGSLLGWTLAGQPLVQPDGTPGASSAERCGPN